MILGSSKLDVGGREVEPFLGLGSEALSHLFENKGLRRYLWLRRRQTEAQQSRDRCSGWRPQPRACAGAVRFCRKVRLRRLHPTWAATPCSPQARQLHRLRMRWACCRRSCRGSRPGPPPQLPHPWTPSAPCRPRQPLTTAALQLSLRPLRLPPLLSPAPPPPRATSRRPLHELLQYLSAVHRRLTPQLCLRRRRRKRATQLRPLRTRPRPHRLR